MNGRLPPCRCDLVAQTLKTSDVEISESELASGIKAQARRSARGSKMSREWGRNLSEASLRARARPIPEAAPESQTTFEAR